MSGSPADRARDLFRAGRFSEALRLLDIALAAAPARAELWSNRGAVLASLRHYEEAVASFGRALALSPGIAGLHRNRANALLALGRHEEAASDYEKALAADPSLPYVRGNFLHSRLQCCDWRGFAEERVRLIEDVRAGRRAASPLAATAILDNPEDQLRAARILAADHPPSPPLWRGENYAHDRIRLAYVSADFAAHATATLMAGVFEQHDRARFETIAISLGPNDRSAMRNRLEGAFDRFIDGADRSAAEIAALLRKLEIDIAIDLKGYTSNARPLIFAQRPAPVQVNYLGYPGTMGVDFIDYIIADHCVIPEAAEHHYREKVVCLPDSYQANDSTRAITAAMPSRATAGLPESGMVFCCFNNSYKILPEVFGIWMSILREIDGSVLWLLHDNDAAVGNLKKEAHERGVDATRLVFAARVPPEDHLARHRLADLFLDTLPYNAHTTASDALWAGVPLLTCTGNTFAGRVAASLLRAAGLTELVTESLEAYRAAALRLARDQNALVALKTKLARNRDTCALFDTARFTRHLETAYLAMHERGRSGLPPAGFSVAAQADHG